MVVWVSVRLVWAGMMISGGWWESSLIAVENRQQFVQPGLHPPEVADVAPMDGIGVMTEVVIGELLQPFQLGVEGGGAGEVDVEGGWLGVHRGLHDVIDDIAMNALFDQEAKLNPMNFRRMVMRIASMAGGVFIKLINCVLCYLVRLYAAHFNLDGVRK
jgi:hypothetical protein